MVTAVDRALGVGESPYLRRDAYAAGVDGRHRFGEGRYELTGSLAMSAVRGSAGAIARTQRSSVHEYQRPDDDLAVDTTRTSLEGTSLRVVAKKVAGLVRATASYQRITPGYETNDFGFLARADEQIVNTNVRFIPTKHGRSVAQRVARVLRPAPLHDRGTARRARCTRRTRAAA